MINYKEMFYIFCKRGTIHYYKGSIGIQQINKIFVIYIFLSL